MIAGLWTDATSHPHPKLLVPLPELLSYLLWPPKTYFPPTAPTCALLNLSYFAPTCTASHPLENLLRHTETYSHTRKATFAPERVCTF